MWLKLVILVLFFCVSCAEDNNYEDSTDENLRDAREFDHKGWQAVETFQEGNSGWIPHEYSQSTPLENIPKRRRLRKRKRRPPIISLTEDSSRDDLPQEEILPIRRRIRPQQLGELREPWEEIENEAVRRPNVRRRIIPVYQPSEDILFSDKTLNINPLSATITFDSSKNQKVEDSIESTEETAQMVYGKSKNISKEDPQTTVLPDLKTVLKQSGGLSLSEILQQKNLSLAELLRGNQRAISALTEKSQDVTGSSPIIKNKSENESTKHKRLPPSIALKKDTNRNYEQLDESSEALTSKEMVEAQRKRLAVLGGHKESKLFASITKYDVVTEPTTERRIFVPSHPKYYTSLNFKPNFKLYDEQTTEPLPQEVVSSTTTTTTTPKSSPTTSRIDLKPKVMGLPITNAKLSKTTTQKTVEEEENYPSLLNFPKPIKISINEVFGFSDKSDINKNDPLNENKDEPFRMTIDLENLTEQLMANETKIEEQSIKIEEIITTTEPLEEKVPYVTAKEEIMEILKDPISRERLSRILENRNMTIQELVEQRERGSSQLHLADIFHNKIREPEPDDEPFVGHINTKYLPNYPRQQKSRIFEEHVNQYSTILNVNSTENVTEKTTKEYSVTSFPTYKIEVPKMNKTQTFPWKELHPDLFSGVPQNNYKESHENLFKKEDVIDPFQFSGENYLEEEIQRLDDIDSKLSLASEEKFNIDDEGFGQEVLINIPSGVKSAIFVSLAIVGLSIIVFLTILVIFRWTQKQKRSLNYCSSLSSKIKSPIILQKRPATAIKSFVNETLGRNKNYYKSNVQRMSDDFWENERNRKQSF